MKCYSSETNATTLLPWTLTTPLIEKNFVIARPAYYAIVTNKLISDTVFFRMIIVAIERALLFLTVEVRTLF